MSEVRVDPGRFLALFFEEAREHLGALEAGLLGLEQDPSDREVLDAIFRSAHSLKGASGSFGLEEVAELAHALETLLERFRAGELAPDPAAVRELLEATDQLEALVLAAEAGEAAPEGWRELAAALCARAGAEGRKVAAAPEARAAARQTYEVFFRPGRDLLRQGLDPLLVLRDLSEVGEIVETRLDLRGLPDLEDLDPEAAYLAWALEVRSDRPASALEEAFAFLDDGSETRITRPSRAARREKGESGPSSIRVATDKLDKLVDLVGELVIAQSMVDQLAKGAGEGSLAHLQEAIGVVDRHVRDLQERVMSVRMVPIAMVVGRVPRLVHDLAAELGKAVAVRIEGEETELDKEVVERLGDPLTHLVRNAVDHGIERPEARRAAGKPDEGTVVVRAFHEAGSVVVEIEDDGGGLDTARIREKAVARGLLDPDAPVSDAEIHACILAPGFSTAEVVTDVSGRGVGMDVVKRDVQALSGALSIDSRPGRGTCFRITLPLTLAILDGLSVRVGAEPYVIPLLAVVEALKPAPEAVKTIVGKGEVVMVRGEPVPLLRLHARFGVVPRAEAVSDGLVVIVEHGGRRIGLLVDEVETQAQVVVKSLEANYRRVDGTMGASILGNGRVALILDVAALVWSRTRRAGERPDERLGDRPGEIDTFEAPRAMGATA